MNRLVIDVGATWIRVGRAERKHLRQHRVFSTPRRWPEAKRAIILIASRLFVDRKVNGVVVGLPGTFDRQRSKLHRAVNLPSWEGQPINHDLSRIFQAPVWLENDAALGALGEATHGAGRGFRIVGYLAVGTGVGGARVAQGKIDRASTHFEPGHHLIESGRTLERWIGGRWLQRRYRQTWPRLTNQQRQELISHLVVGLRKLAARWSPDIFVLGGGIIMKGRIPMVMVRRQVRQPGQSSTLSIQRAQLGDLAGLWGGAAYRR